ncbi:MULTISPECIES: hypothetical protein [Streptacidiphilus]|uniref:Uncharacterized protein n=1 Tax=Streptacidiphilus cavernicola TaxID=3342716 RepID=A0ABV6UHA0_9ACTN|nr:hypothetical protein [Streptacidiphilus jeojiense]
MTDPHQADDQPTPHIPDYPIELPPLLPGQVLARTIPHGGELRPRGFLITCAYCDATRDWLIVEVLSKVYIRCRCTHEWLEPDLDLDAFNDLFGEVIRVWDSFPEVVAGLGFDGTFAGTYLD